MAISNLLTGRVRVVSPKNVTSDRYQFLDVSQAEPNFGVPSFSASLYDNPAILVSDSDGNRGFIQFAPTAKQIASGSATASISPNLGLQVNVDTTIAGNLYVSKSIYAKQIIIDIVSSSIIYSSGSNIFGDEITDVQQFTGSVNVRDFLIANEITASSIAGALTGSFIGQLEGTGSFKGNVEASGSFTGSFTGSFFGDGRDLFNLPQATKLSTGSITASVSPDYGFKVESLSVGSQISGSLYISGSTILTGSLNAEQITGSISGSFTGDGRGLFNIPRSAFSGDAYRIASGSVTASTTPDYGFKVESLASGSQFTGSINVTGSMVVTGSIKAFEFTGSLSSSFIQGDGRGLFNIPRSALTPDALVATLIATGSVTASVTPEYGFKVTSVASGSQFTGSVAITGSLRVTTTSGSLILDSSSAYYGEGTYLRNIPRSALTPDALLSTLITSGSVTASVAPNTGFVVTSVVNGSTFTGSIFVTGSVSSDFFVGDGSRLTNVPSTVAPRIASGSATASIAPNTGFVVNTFSQFQAVSSSVFTGSGAGLWNIPRSALTQDALISTFIASGSVTASVAPNYGFKVEALESGSQFTGSIRISGSAYVESGSYFVGDGSKLTNVTLANLSIDSTRIFSGSATASISPAEGFKVNTFSTFDFPISASMFTGSGRGLFDIPRSALTPDALVAGLIASGSVTASTVPNLGFIVLSADSGSQFTGSLFVSGARGIEIASGSSYSGSGERLFNIPIKALKDLDLSRIVSGSATASISPNNGFVVNTFSTFSGSVIISASAAYYPSASLNTIFNVTNFGITSYIFNANGISNPTLTLVRGLTYTFNISATGHPFWIKTTKTTGTVNQYNTGVTNNGASNGTITFVVPADAPDILYYNCEMHAAMAGVFNIVDGYLQREPQLLVIGDTVVSGSIKTNSPAIFTSTITASMFSGSGRGLFDIPESALSFAPYQIASGSVTASVSPDYGFRLIGGDARFTSSVFISQSLAVNKNITAVSMSAYEISGSFLGDGSRLTNLIVPPTISYKIASGSVTGSVSPNFGFVVVSSDFGMTLTGSLFVSGTRGIELASGSSYSGSGARLYDIPRSALAPDALLTSFIASGSITASVSPQYGFKVEAAGYRSQFTGSVDVSGSISVNSGSYYSGSGEKLFNIPISAIANLDLSKIFSGSVTASVSPTYGFVVTAAASGSHFTGSIYVSGSVSSSAFIGDGSRLTNIPFSALSQELYRVASGSVTASALPKGFIVESLASGSQFTGSINVTGSISIPSGSGYFSGSGKGLFDIPESALSFAP